MRRLFTCGGYPEWLIVTNSCRGLQICNTSHSCTEKTCWIASIVGAISTAAISVMLLRVGSQRKVVAVKGADEARIVEAKSAEVTGPFIQFAMQIGPITTDNSATVAEQPTESDQQFRDDLQAAVVSHNSADTLIGIANTTPDQTVRRNIEEVVNARYSTIIASFKDQQKANLAKADADNKLRAIASDSNASVFCSTRTGSQVWRVTIANDVSLRHAQTSREIARKSRVFHSLCFDS